jgi:hypothetical protein
MSGRSHSHVRPLFMNQKDVMVTMSRCYIDVYVVGVTGRGK